MIKIIDCKIGDVVVIGKVKILIKVNDMARSIPSIKMFFDAPKKVSIDRKEIRQRKLLGVKKK